jgi:hypothetical protein
MRRSNEDLDLLKVPSFDEDPKPSPVNILRRYIKIMKTAYRHANGLLEQSGSVYYSPGVIPKEQDE